MLSLLFKLVSVRDLWSQAISIGTNSDIVHVEILLPGGTCFSSREPHGVGYADVDFSDPSRWIKVDLPEVGITPDALRWAESILGAGYDFLGAISSPWLSMRDSSRWFCSEACAEFLSHCTGGTKYVPDGNIQVTPAMLYARVTGKVAAIGDRLDALSDTLAAVNKAATDLDAKINQFDMGNVNALVSEAVASVHDARVMLNGMKSAIAALEGKI